jgi:hypothetical protein
MNSPRTNKEKEAKILDFTKGVTRDYANGWEESWTDEKIRQYEKFEPNEEFWEGITKQYPHAEAAYDAFATDSNAHLFIIVVSEGADVKIYYFTKQNSTPVTITKIETIIEFFTLRNGIKPKWDTLGDNIVHQRENDVKDSGIRFYDYLLMGYLFSIDAAGLEGSFGDKSVSCSKELKEKFQTNKFLLDEKCSITPKKKDEWELRDEERTYRVKKDGGKLNIYLMSKEKKLNSYLRGKRVLPNECDSMCGVWIYCDDEFIKPLWEWLYTEENFWGDEFAIVRIQEGCDMADYQVNSEVIILADDSTGDLLGYAQDLKKELNKAGVSVCSVIPPSDTELDISSDCIIYAAGVDAYKKYKNKLEVFFSDRKEILFWNLYPSSPLQLEELPATWLDSRFEGLHIPKAFTLCFVKTFFDVLKELLKEVNGANEEREVRVAEILRKTREKMISNQKGSQFNNLWRLAYILNGNPCTKLTIRPRH